MKPLILTCALLAGCAAEPQFRWERPGATGEAWYVDRGACRAQAYSVADALLPQMVAVFESCLESKGWHRVPK